MTFAPESSHLRAGNEREGRPVGLSLWLGCGRSLHRYHPEMSCAESVVLCSTEMVSVMTVRSQSLGFLTRSA